MNTSENINETYLDKEFVEFMVVEVEEIPKEEEEIDDNFEELPLNEQLRIKTSIQDPPTDLEMKPLLGHLEYAFVEKDSLSSISHICSTKKQRKRTDYRKMNEATRKDHFHLPFMDQMLEMLSGNKFFCFLDVFSGYFQIPIKPADEEKTTYTCPFGTYAYKRMPFGLCNAPVTFQRRMIAIFQAMLETSMEVFMDDFSVFEYSFDSYLSNLEQMLIRCKQADLVSTWRNVTS
ncbi:reverse transcriptase domain-containing protein [Tanacetum coccineum]